MATKYWQGSTGVWDTAANWSGGVAPVANDDVVFDDSSQSVTTQPGVGIVFTSVRVTPKYTGSWGASGSAISNISATEFVWRGSGEECWFAPIALSRATIGPQGTGANAMVLGSAATSLGVVYVTAGQVTLVAATTMGVMTMTGYDGLGGASPPELILPAGLTWSATSKVISRTGRIQIYSAPTATTDEFVSCEGGEIWHRLGQIDNVFLKAGVYRHDAGAIGTVWQTGGYWNSRQSVTSRVVSVFYACNDDSVADFRNDAAQGIPTALIRFGNPEVYLPEGSY